MDPRKRSWRQPARGDAADFAAGGDEGAEVNKTIGYSIALGVTLAATPALAEPLHLLCSGRAETTDTGLGDDTVVKSLDETVQFRIDGNTGTALLPKLILPTIGKRKGWLEMRDVAQSDAEITGRVPYGISASARLKIDRIRGVATLDGPAGTFSGQCAPYDAGAQPKF